MCSNFNYIYDVANVCFAKYGTFVHRRNCFSYICFVFKFKKKYFLGDSGSLFLGCLIGLSIILDYNIQISNIRYPVESIFIALMLPGIDMLRVFAVRIINNKNPFTPDRSHLHHLLISQGINSSNILTIFALLILLPILLNFFTSFKSIYIILFYILFYFVLFLRLKKFIC